jgi:serine/threonine protein kinase
VLRDFTHDVLTVANLHHPHVLQVVNAGCDESGVPFVVTEQLPGRTLAERLAATGGPLPVAEVLSIVRGVASALSAAHAVGVAHGALGVESVFIAELAGYYPHGFPKLCDLGVARLAAAARGGGAADARADQLALAALAQRLLAGEAPPAEAAPFSALTQQFFAEGDRQEAEAGTSPAAHVPDRVPRRRAPAIAAVLLGAITLAIVAWSMVWPIRGGVPARAFDRDVLPRPAAAALSVTPTVAPPTTRTASSELRRTGAARRELLPAHPRTEPPPVAPLASPAPAASPAPPPAAGAVDEQTDEELAAGERAAEQAKQAAGAEQGGSTPKPPPAPSEPAGP